MTPSDLERLEELAKDATPGPWKLREYSNIFGYGTALDSEVKGNFGGLQTLLRKEDHSYIAAASPDVILGLIHRVKVLERSIDIALVHLGAEQSGGRKFIIEKAERELAEEEGGKG